MLLKKCEKSLYKLLEDLNEVDKIHIEKAYSFAKKAHEGQKRKSGEQYMTHPLAVGLSLWKKFKNIDLLIAGFLHDTVEDNESIKIETIYKKFGDNVGFIVDSVTKTEEHFLSDDTIFEDHRDKILSGGIKNIGCILVKLADREHNLATLSYMPEHKQIKKSFESQALYLPLIDILNFKKDDNSIQKSQEYLQKYLEKNNIKDPKKLKNKLLNICFNNFSEEIFNVIYENSSNVVWEIGDKKVFDGLVKSGWFDSGSVDIKKIEVDGSGLFKAYFVFKGGSNFDSKNLKISISSSRFIS